MLLTKKQVTVHDMKPSTLCGRNGLAPDPIRDNTFLNIFFPSLHTMLQGSILITQETYGAPFRKERCYRA